MLSLISRILLSTLLFCLGSSGLYLTVKVWWGHPYYSEYPWRALLAWPSLALDLGTDGFRSLPLRDKLPLAMAGLAGILLAYAAWTGTGRALRNRAQFAMHGRARWQSVYGAYRSGIRFHLTPPGDGVILGKLWSFGPFAIYASLPGDWHVSLTAQTGAGKGVGFVIPNCLNWAGPLIFFSVKDDVAKAVLAERQRKGDQTFYFDLTNPGLNTNQYSCIGEVDSAYSVYQRVMFTLIPEIDSNSKYWNDFARALATAICVLLHEGKIAGKVCIGMVQDLCSRPDYDQHFRELIEDARVNRMHDPSIALQRASNIILGWLNNGDNVAGPAKESVRSTITTALALWNIPEIDAATRRDDFQLEKIRQQRITIAVVAQPGDIRRLRPIYSLFFSELFERNARQEWNPKIHRPVRTLCVFDERWALGSIQVVDDAIAFIRSYGIRVLTILQTKDQMKRALGEEGARNLFNNQYVELIYGGTDYDTAKEVSERMGKLGAESIAESKPRWLPFSMSKETENKQLQARLLMLPQEVSHLDGDTVVVLIKGKHPLKLKKIIWYKDDYFKRMAGPMPKLPKLNVVKALEKC